jgi:arabinose-5-phosphate isomerase
MANDEHFIVMDAPSTSRTFNAERALHLARLTFDIEAQALLGLKDRQDANFANAVHAMLTGTGRVVVMGMGKSGHVGRKIAATLASTGTPAMWTWCWPFPTRVKVTSWPRFFRPSSASA